jgi:hypothetical protein
MHSHAIGRATRCCAEPVGKSLHGISEIAKQMPPISNLDHARRTLTNAVRINAGAVAGDNLDTWVIAQPSGHRCGVAVRQQINHYILFQVDEHRAVSMTPPPCPVVDPENPRCCGSSGRRSCTDQAQ